MKQQGAYWPLVEMIYAVYFNVLQPELRVQKHIKRRLII